ncbi:ABC transporter ATP-binding protein [Arthrobacter sp. EpRS71]|uniref:ABC transporter ATP-binding protein n=1 Tax=Arthrobacter sp. EpRS71 TaxID=1743141 RepID=UPI000748FD57|nr:ABC transporter ATP-binding protein [Arthrobacter sp. EpRS71]KUM42204.1 ABC transporter ATP-binding protein [Arthrobacter sp. EpRS71]
MPDVVVKNLRKDFGGITVLHEVSFTIKDGEFFTLLGPSGCGKSTTLSCLAGLEQPTSGSIAVGTTVLVDDSSNKFVPPEERNLGMVFQSYALWPHMTLAENLAMPLNIRKVPKAEQKTLIRDALDKVGLAHLAQRYPHQLSGGQQQRVALARALVYSPKVLLLDEPLSNLDAKLREQARVWLKRLQSELGITTVYVTHDQEEALAMSDRIAVMSNGNMLQVAPPEEIYERPATAEVAAFIGRSNFLDGTITSTIGDRAVVRLEDTGETVTAVLTGEMHDGDSVTVAFRPEKASLAPVDDSVPSGHVGLPVEILTTSYVGSRYEYELRYGARTLAVDSKSNTYRGDLMLIVPIEALRLYPRANVVSADAAELMAVIH